MASIKNLKKDLNYIFSDIIEECYVWQQENLDKKEKAEVVIDNAITSFDTLVEKINNKTDNVNEHFKSILSELEEKVNDLRSQIDSL
jgi:peptidoglycan hydrolase CwlO-like protein